MDDIEIMKSSFTPSASPENEHLREQPAGLPRSLVALFAIASGLSVANVYYAQPLFDALGRDFHIRPAAVGGGITATQIGCALALLLLVSLGDRVERRRLMAVQLLALTAALAAVALTRSAPALLAGMLGTAMTQGLIA
ncbi:putative MFS family arabinose efflux permease [Herbaspirillum frisingense]|uniref:MFS family arabinose efflux permease n=1 Tax=Herbaspirillum frisingense TaxID=92645 RepID=A0ABU1PHI3_9BURK|nr:putative MFS family arabinose efflux permease [Herbaspirillum frisingense]